MSDRAMLGRFLRQQRERLTPEEISLPDGARRRTPGLRRQEVAQRAGISVEYYVKLEQGRGATPSVQVLTALGRALALTAAERDHLFRLGGDVVPPAAPLSGEVSSAVRFLVANMPEVPAYVVDARWEVLVWNELAEWFIGGLLAAPHGHRNLARWMFEAPEDDPYWVSEAAVAFARIVVADLRSSFLRHPDDLGMRDLLAGLRRRSVRFVALWEERGSEQSAVQKALVIPKRGEFLFDCQMLQIGSTGQQLIAYCSDADSPVREALREVVAGSLAVSPQVVRYSA